MKIRSVRLNNHKKVFDVQLARRSLRFPYAKADPPPSPSNRVTRVFVDPELGREAFTYVLESGAEGSVHVDHVLEYNEDPTILRDLLLHKLTLEAEKRMETTKLSKREITRRLGSSATQLYRLLDPTNRRKSVDQMLFLLHVLDCNVDFVVKERREQRGSTTHRMRRRPSRMQAAAAGA